VSASLSVFLIVFHMSIFEKNYARTTNGRPCMFNFLFVFSLTLQGEASGTLSELSITD